MIESKVILICFGPADLNLMLIMLVKLLEQKFCGFSRMSISYVYITVEIFNKNNYRPIIVWKKDCCKVFIRLLLLEITPFLEIKCIPDVVLFKEDA